MNPGYDVFLSYRRSDAAAVLGIAELLVAAGFRVSPLVVVLSGETAGEAIRTEIAGVLATRVTATCTFAEAGIAATAAW